MVEVEQPGVTWFQIDRSDHQASTFTRATISSLIVAVARKYEDTGIYWEIKHPKLLHPHLISNDFVFGIPGADYIKSGEMLHCLLLIQSGSRMTSRSLDVESSLYERVGLFIQSFNDFKIRGEKRYLFKGFTERAIVNIIWIRMLSHL